MTARRSLSQVASSFRNSGGEVTSARVPAAPVPDGASCHMPAGLGLRIRPACAGLLMPWGGASPSFIGCIDRTQGVSFQCNGLDFAMAHSAV